ncbi:histidine phosphatase family protein [Actinoplanes sp. NPDC051851]|uniref:histidine phosphatase family protein n=1 Tax=Actinoplanes sp. NPDC051851 TaxID=3154753 RepID=UPI0034181272
MIELTVIRHAEAHCNVAGIVGGPRSCTGLTEHGRCQARLLAARLHRRSTGTQRPTTIYSSPRRRVVETAEIIAASLDLPVAHLDDLRDPDYGPTADGQLWSTLTAAARETGHATDLTTPLAPGGESWSQYVIRTNALLGELIIRHRGERLLLVGHAETVQALHQALLELPPTHKTKVKYAVENASLTTWHREQSRWTLICHNDYFHLE